MSSPEFQHIILTFTTTTIPYKTTHYYYCSRRAKPNALETRKSALEECLLAWNRLSPDLSGKSYATLKNHLRASKYSDRAVEQIGMFEAVLLL